MPKKLNLNTMYISERLLESIARNILITLHAPWFSLS